MYDTLASCLTMIRSLRPSSSSFHCTSLRMILPTHLFSILLALSIPKAFPASAWVTPTVPAPFRLPAPKDISSHPFFAQFDDTEKEGEEISNTTIHSTPGFIPTGLQPWQEEELLNIFDDALFRMAFFMERTEALLQMDPDDSAEDDENEHEAEIRALFRTCGDSVAIGTSTIPNAGRGLFASRDIPLGTVVAFYPVHSIGCKFQSGSCLSVQIVPPEAEMIDVERSAYALYSLIERPLLGVDLNTQYAPHAPKLFVDMNPNVPLYEGWFCGLINDAAMVRHHGDVDYYPVSRGPAQNVEIVPFGRTAPFQVAVTTRDVPKGEELFVSYGYNYWVAKIGSAMEYQDKMPSSSSNDVKQGVAEWRRSELEKQEGEAAQQILAAAKLVYAKYATAAESVAEIFEGLGPLPTCVATKYPEVDGNIDCSAVKQPSKANAIGGWQQTPILKSGWAQFIRQPWKNGRSWLAKTLLRRGRQTSS